MLKAFISIISHRNEVEYFMDHWDKVARRLIQIYALGVTILRGIYIPRTMYYIFDFEQNVSRQPKKMQIAELVPTYPNQYYFQIFSLLC